MQGQVCEGFRGLQLEETQGSHRLGCGAFGRVIVIFMDSAVFKSELRVGGESGYK